MIHSARINIIPLRNSFRQQRFFCERFYSVLFFGSDEFSAVALQRLHEQFCNKSPLVSRLEVVCPPNTAKNNKNFIYLNQYATRLGLPVHRAPPKTLDGWNPPEGFDMAIVVSFGYFLPSSLLSKFRNSLNIHPSLLPKYRGAAPIQYSILNNDKVCGVSIIELHPKIFDAGKILKQAQYDIPKPRIMYQELHDFLSIKSADMLIETISTLEDSKSNAIVQDSSNASFARKISKDMAKINWAQMDSEEVFTRYRALGSKIPLTAMFRNKSMQLHELQDPIVNRPPAELKPESEFIVGTMIFASVKPDTIWILCKNNTWIACRRLQVQGKNPLGIEDFINGYKFKSGAEFLK